MAGPSLGGVKQLLDRRLVGEIDVAPVVSRTIGLDDVNCASELMEAQDGIRSVNTYEEGVPMTTGDALAVHESDQDGVRLIEVFGELDLATAPRLCSALDRARAERAGRVVVDLTGVDFCDSTGLRALIGASTELRVGGGRLAISCLPGGAVARLFDVVGARETLRVCDTLQDAVASVAGLTT